MNKTDTHAARPGLRSFADPSLFDIRESDRILFEQMVGDFIPAGTFDAHAHWYDLRHLLPDADLTCPEVGYQAMLDSMQRWMGPRVIREGLYFPFPVRELDCHAANQFLASQLVQRPACRGLMMIRPDDDPAQVEDVLRESGFAGFKVYHVLARRSDTFQAAQGEFLPEWAWELADQYELWITMHMVRSTALSDPDNLSYIVQQCRRYPNARMVLAHAARGFHAGHTIDAIDGLRSIDNVYFDSSAICEPMALEAILRATGTTRLMYGSDFPISEVRGKAVSVGEGFYWIYDHTADFQDWPHGGLVPIGIESLAALRQATRTMCLSDEDVERIMGGTARQLLKLVPSSSGQLVQQQYEHARERIPGGTQLLSKRPEMFAPGHWPAYYEQAIGCEIVDSSGRRLLDMSLGGILACVLGYADPDVNAAVIRRVHLGSMATLQTYDEVRLADLLIEIHPWAEMARFARTGGEGMAVAVRIARAATGRDKVAICGYHGWHDWYLSANLGAEGPQALASHLLPGLEPSGVPRGLSGTTLPFHYNRLDEVEAIIAAHGKDLAAIVMEPTRHVDPEPGFLEGVRELTRRAGAKLIFDEISIGWRLCLGGAHLRYGIQPDLAVFAKAISNGFAMSAVIGDRTTMLAAEQSFISSAYWTEGIGPAAALAAIGKMRTLNVPAHLAEIGGQVMRGWCELGQRHGVPAVARGRPELTLLALDHPDANALMTLFTRRMLERGILAGGNFSATLAHQPHHVQRYLRAVDEVFPELAEAIAAGDVLRRIDGRVKHTMFARLTGDAERAQAAR